MAKNFSYPEDGALRQYYAPGDFFDSQCVPLPQPAPDASDLAAATLFRMPGWAKALLDLRNLIVGPFGLKTGAHAAPPMVETEKLGNIPYSGIFQVHSVTPDEVILGINDRHLDFRVSVLRSQAANALAISTWVHPHNLAGKAYLALVYPFHRVIVARCLAGAVNQ